MDNLRRQFSQIYDKYVDKIYRFVYFKVNSQETAEDLCSEVFFRGWKVFQERKKIENTQAFLYQIARNLVTDFYREKGKFQTISTEFAREIVDPKPNSEEKALINSDIEEVRAVLVGLKEDYQNVIIWHYVDNYSISEIAKMSDKSEGAIRVTLHRALKELKNRVSEA